MQQIPILFKELSIRKIPGFPRGMRPYRHLSPQINIVVGPNASGKSSTARLIQQLIWRSDGKGSEAEGYADIGDETWKIRMDAGNFRTQRNGQEDTLTGLPSPQAQDRYMLALHQLVGIDEKDLAHHIIRESIGGYNLDAAAQDLGYSLQIKPKNIKEYKDFEKSEQDLKDIQRQQEGLKKKEAQLQELYQQHDAAKEAMRLKDFYHRVIEYLQAIREKEQWQKQYDSYPGIMEQINGTEYTQLQDLEQMIQDDQNNIEIARRELQQARDQLSMIDLPEDGIDDQVLRELEVHTGELEQMERSLKEKEREMEDHQAQVEEALKALDPSLDLSQWEGIDLQGVQSLENFLLRSHQTISQLQFLQARIAELEKETGNNPSFSSDTLGQGMRSLSLWLQQQRNQKGTTARWVLVLSLAGAGLAVLTYLAGWPGLLGILILPVLYYFALQQRPSGPSTTRRQDFIRTGLTPPGQWDIEQVIQRLEGLTRELEQAIWQEKIHQTLEDRRGELEEMENQLQEIQKSYDQWQQQLKALPHLPGEDTRNYSGLYDFVKNLNRWQQEYTRLKGARAGHHKYLDHYDQILEQIHRLIRPYHSKTLREAAQARATYQSLREQEEDRRSHISVIKQKEEVIEKLGRDMTRNQEKLRHIYDKLGLEEASKERVRQLVEQLDAYKEVRQNYRDAARRKSEKEDQVKDHSLYEAHKRKLSQMSLDQALEQARHYQEQADKKDEIIQRISDIQAQINQARQGNAMEDALLEREKAWDALAGLYEQNISAMTGQLLVNQLKQETREHSRPAIFTRARELFTQITSGRYELMLDETDEPAFRARDTIWREGQDLEELSTGTQIQLLLSVRLAYIESQESALKLPILADELLANSDDNRARAIIEALMEISRQGRQVFYFTAQKDEVVKWKSYCRDAAEVDYKIMELPGDPKNPDVPLTQPTDLPTIRLSQENIPDPQDKSRQEYGRQLQVPAFNLLNDYPEQLHLWYVLDDPLALYRCLVKGLRYWGQLESFLSHKGRVRGLTPRDLPLLQDKIKVLRRLQTLYRQGRPRPVDRQVLLSSGAVSEKFIEPVARLLKQVEGNPRRLLYHLREGEVQGFWKNKMEDLKEYLLEQGYLDEQPLLDPDEIRVRLAAQISNTRMEDDQAQRFIDEILGSQKGSGAPQKPG